MTYVLPCPSAETMRASTTSAAAVASSRPLRSYRGSSSTSRRSCGISHDLSARLSLSLSLTLCRSVWLIRPSVLGNRRRQPHNNNCYPRTVVFRRFPVRRACTRPKTKKDFTGIYYMIIVLYYIFSDENRSDDGKRRW